MPRKGISFPPKDAALRDDVHLLGNLVGEMLRDQCGAAVFDAVEGDRQAAIGRREGDAEDSVALVVRTQGRPPDEALELIRAFSAWFQVVNMAEKVHRVRRRRHYVNDKAGPQPGGLEDCFVRLKAHGLSLEQALTLLAKISIEPVLTAHPTESTRRTILRQQQRVARLLMARLDPAQTPAESAVVIDRVRTELTTGWQTADNSRERLTVADEREHVLFFLVEVIYKVIPVFYEEIEATLVRVYGDDARAAVVPEMLHFGSWVGGDMAGHPDVHAKTIRESCARHHQLIINRYYLDAQALAEKLSQSSSRVEVLPAISDRIEQYRNLVPGARSVIPATHDRMPYRVFLGQIAERLRAAYDGRSGQYERAAQLIDDLELIERSLRAYRGTHAGLFHVRRMLRRVRTFGLHLATLDVRQNVEAHRQVVGHALGDAEWSQRPRMDRIARLRTALEHDEAPSDALDAACKRAFWVFEAIEYCRHRYGPAAIGSYVVSMANDVDDLLEVLLIARWSGMVDEATGQVPLDVAPLFESADALERADDIITRLLAEPGYRAHLAARGNRQTVMIGYADSNKSTGVVSSRWLVRRAQEAMVAACEAAGVTLLVFHGRGGAMGRGGRRGGLVRSMPAGAVRGQLRITEQGESINDRYGLRAIAFRTFEQMLHSLALTTAGVRRPDHGEPLWRDAMTHMAETSRVAYRALVHAAAGVYRVFPGRNAGRRHRTRPDRLAPGLACRRTGCRGPAGDPVDPVLVAEPSHAAGLVWRRDRPQGHRRAVRRCHRIRDVPRLGVLRGPDRRHRDGPGAGRHGHRRLLRSARPTGARPVRNRHPGGVRAHPGTRAGGQRVRGAARFRTDPAALDTPAQPLRRSDPPHPGRPASPLARGRPAGSWRS